jgi:endonuclease/exonuclease/phosphatase family metal-dependent hydrolase
MELTIMTFNLRVDVPSDNENAWLHRADKTAEMILRHNPSIIGIQEGLSYMLTDIGDRFKNYKWIGQGREIGKTGELSAIFYRKDVLKIVDEGQFWLSEHPEEPGSKSWGTDYPRICTWGHFQFLSNLEKEFVLFNTHLDHISQEAREKGIRMVWDKMDTQLQKKIPTILTGDFNATPENNVIKFLNDKEELVNAYSILEGDIGVTFHNFLGGTEGQPIDYIFATKDFQLQNTIIDRNTIDGGFPSDHYPIFLKTSI